MMAEKEKSQSNYKGFVAGVFSGVAKLTGMSFPSLSTLYLRCLSMTSQLCTFSFLRSNLYLYQWQHTNSNI